MNASLTALPKRLLRVKRQSARLAELQALRAAGEFRRTQDAAAAGQQAVQIAAEGVRSRLRQRMPVETLQAGFIEVDALMRESVRLDAAARSAGEAYRQALAARRKADVEVEAFEELLARREAVLRKQAERQSQQAADDWTLRKWNGADAEGVTP